MSLRIRHGFVFNKELLECAMKKFILSNTINEELMKKGCKYQVVIARKLLSAYWRRILGAALSLFDTTKDRAETWSTGALPIKVTNISPNSVKFDKDDERTIYEPVKNLSNVTSILTSREKFQNNF